MVAAFDVILSNPDVILSNPDVILSNPDVILSRRRRISRAQPLPKPGVT